jgi:hypothetical protein
VDRGDARLGQQPIADFQHGFLDAQTILVHEGIESLTRRSQHFHQFDQFIFRRLRVRPSCRKTAATSTTKKATAAWPCGTGSKGSYHKIEDFCQSFRGSPARTRTWIKRLGNAYSIP